MSGDNTSTSIEFNFLSQRLQPCKICLLLTFHVILLNLINRQRAVIFDYNLQRSLRRLEYSFPGKAIKN